MEIKTSMVNCPSCGHPYDSAKNACCPHCGGFVPTEAPGGTGGRLHTYGAAEWRFCAY